MLAYSPYSGAPGRRLGQFGGVTTGIAKAIVDQAEPATRRLIRDERTKLAEALIAGIPFAAVSAIAFVGTSYLVEEGARGAKFAGYAASAGLLGIGAVWTFSRITEHPEAAAPPPGAAPEIAREAAKAIVDQAEPRIKQIVNEERARIAESLLTGLPFWVAASGAFAATAFLVKDESKVMKTVGYSASALIYGIGAWAALEKERG